MGRTMEANRYEEKIGESKESRRTVTRGSFRYRSLSENDLIRGLGSAFGSIVEPDGTTDGNVVPPEAIVIENDRRKSLLSDFDDDITGVDDDEEEDDFFDEDLFEPQGTPKGLPLTSLATIGRLRERNHEKFTQTLHQLARYNGPDTDRTRMLREFLKQTWIREFVHGDYERERLALKEFNNLARTATNNTTTAKVVSHTDDFFAGLDGHAGPPSLARVLGGHVSPVFPFKKRTTKNLRGGGGNNNTDTGGLYGENQERQRREQLIERLAWCSFHTPRCVLEDLTQVALDQDLAECPHKHSSNSKRQRKSTLLVDDDSFSSLSVDASDVDAESEKSASNGRASLASVAFSTLNMPYNVKRQSALVFVDISGFTKLSRMQDVESLSKIINSYFRKMVDEVVRYGGDILKFAGDAFFAEWRVATEDEIDAERERLSKNHPLTNLRASFLSVNGEMERSMLEERSLAECVKAASLCAASMVELYSDFRVVVKSDELSVSFGSEQQGKLDAMLNVHCGVGVGTLVGLHVGDELQRGENMARREFLFLGDPIDQVAAAADAAKDGEVYASPEAVDLLKETCRLPRSLVESKQPVRIASKNSSLVRPRVDTKQSAATLASAHSRKSHFSLYDDLIAHCSDMDESSLNRLHRQLSLYVHPVVRGDELDTSTSHHRGTEQTKKTKDDPYVFLRNQSELRSVYTMFIKAVMSPKVTGDDESDARLYSRLQKIMRVTCREFNKYRGHLRQFIVDDKGVVLIGTFGLRGSTVAHMVAKHALPATFAIHSALKEEVGVDNRIGATFGKVYCGVVGGIRRHEFAVMGAPVNLAARLMYSPKNNGVLVDEAVQKNAHSRFAFNSLPPVKAKGYDRPVIIFEPLHEVIPRKRGVSHGFIGRKQDVKDLTDVAKSVMEGPEAKTMMAFIIGDAGMGKTALGLSISDEMKKYTAFTKKRFIFARSTSTETEQRIPLSSFRKIFLGAIRELCIHDGTLSVEEGGRGSAIEPRPRRLMRGTSRRGSFSRHRSRRFSIPKNYSRRVSAAKLTHNDSTKSMNSLKSQNVPYLKKLCEVCQLIDYQYEYADIVGSQLLGLESANPITHVDGHVPSIDEVVEFLTKAYIQVTHFADLSIIFLDDFQWIDSLTWKVVRLLCERGKHMLLMGAMRSQETPALRRMSSVALWHGQMQSRIVEVSLGPLELDEVREMISKVLDYDESVIDDALCNDVYQRTGGLPIYLVELLESVKRNKAVAMDDESGRLRWTADAENEHKRIGINNMAAIELSFLHRFDLLEKTVRQVLQTCAVLGMSFALSDVVRVHVNMTEPGIDNALNAAVDELILVEDIEDDEEEEDASQWSGDDSKLEPRTTTTWNAGDGDRYFQFSHAMWRKSVLDKMLKEQKINLHKRIAEAMEGEQVVNMESSDIGRLLTLFDHWKSCGNFGKAAPLALAVGLRLEDWDLSAQSLDLYRDALEMCYESADNSDGREPVRDEKELWLPASAPPPTVEFILRLHIRIAKCHAHLGEQEQCATTFEDAYKIMTTSPKAAKLNQELVLPIISGLCSIAIQRSPSDGSALKQEELVERFVREARDRADDIHICRALSMKAAFFARIGSFEDAIETQRELKRVYDIEQHSGGIREEYGKDYAAQCLADAIQWHCLLEDYDIAEAQIDLVISSLVPHLDLRDVDAVMEIIFPVLIVMKSIGRCDDAEKLLFNNAINPFHDLNGTSLFGYKLFNPLAYLLYIIKMETENSYDEQLLTEIEDWVLDGSNCRFHPDWERKGYVLIGEICWRLVRFKVERGEECEKLQEQGRRVLMRVVFGRDDDRSDTYMLNSAQFMLNGMDELEDDDDDESLVFGVGPEQEMSDVSESQEFTQGYMMMSERSVASSTPSPTMMQETMGYQANQNGSLPYTRDFLPLEESPALPRNVATTSSHTNINIHNNHTINNNNNSSSNNNNSNSNNNNNSNNGRYRDHPPPKPAAPRNNMAPIQHNRAPSQHSVAMSQHNGRYRDPPKSAGHRNVPPPPSQHRGRYGDPAMSPSLRNVVPNQHGRYVDPPEFVQDPHLHHHHHHHHHHPGTQPVEAGCNCNIL